MSRLLFIGVIVVVVLSVYTLVDCAMLDRARIRGLPRWAWLLVILFVPVIGPLLWLFIGRGRRGASDRGGRRSMAPDDDPEFLRRLGEEATQQERIRRMEQELADLDNPDADDSGSGHTKSDPSDGDMPGRRDA
jgi:hypothetical protein